MTAPFTLAELADIALNATRPQFSEVRTWSVDGMGRMFNLPPVPMGTDMDGAALRLFGLPVTVDARLPEGVVVLVPTDPNAEPRIMVVAQ